MGIIVYTRPEWYDFLKADNSFTREILEKVPKIHDLDIYDRFRHAANSSGRTPKQTAFSFINYCHLHFASIAIQSCASHHRSRNLFYFFDIFPVFSGRGRADAFDRSSCNSRL